MAAFLHWVTSARAQILRTSVEPLFRTLRSKFENGVPGRIRIVAGSWHPYIYVFAVEARLCLPGHAVDGRIPVQWTGFRYRRVRIRWMRNWATCAFSDRSLFWASPFAAILNKKKIVHAFFVFCFFLVIVTISRKYSTLILPATSRRSKYRTNKK